MGSTLGSGVGSGQASRAQQSRVNGSRSSGPVTSDGKAASARNALKHGMYSRAVLLPGEDVEEYNAFVSDLHIELRPDGALQTLLVQRTAELGWKLRRLPAVEATILGSARVCFERETEDPEAGKSPGGIGDLLHQLIGRDQDGIMMRIQRYEVRLERSMERSLRELRLVKKDAREAMGLEDSGSFGSSDQRPRTAVRGTTADGAVGSFRSNGAVTGGEPGGREAAVVCQQAPPSRGPSAAPQDDISSSGLAGEADSRSVGVGAANGGTSVMRAGGSGSFRTNDAAALSAASVGGSASGSFRQNGVVSGSNGVASGSFGAKVNPALRSAAHAAVPTGKRS